MAPTIVIGGCLCNWRHLTHYYFEAIEDVADNVANLFLMGTGGGGESYS